jgi:hypothetical protein
MAEYSRLAKGRFTSTGAAKAIYLPFKPDYIEILNYTAAATPANHGIPKAYWDEDMGQGFGIVDLFNATPVLTMDSVDSNGFTTFEAGQMLQFGASQQVVGITKANPAVVTVTGHGYSTGDVVVFNGLYQSSTTGMAQLAGMPFVITKTGTDTFTIPWNTNQSNFTALSASPSGATVRKVLYPFLYAPGVSFVSALTLASTTTVVTTAPHNCVVGQEVAFRIPQSYGTVQLNSLPNTLIPGSPAYGYVVSVTNSTTVVVNIDSSAYTAFNSNQTIASVPGLQFPQMVAVGDVNTGGIAISSGSVLYPPPVVNGVNTINGPAINGAFVNNTRSGFVIGAGTAAGDTSSVLVGAASDVIYWRAYLHDYS